MNVLIIYKSESRSLLKVLHCYYCLLANKIFSISIYLAVCWCKIDFGTVYLVSLLKKSCYTVTPFTAVDLLDVLKLLANIKRLVIYRYSPFKRVENSWDCWTDIPVYLQIKYPLYLDTLLCCWYIFVTPSVADSSREAFAHNHLGYLIDSDDRLACYRIIWTDWR